MPKNLVLQLSLLLCFGIFVGCSPSKLNQQIIVTRMMAELDGKLKLDGECLRVDSDNGGSALLLWPPDYAVTLQGDALHITEGIVSGTRVEYILHIGDPVHLAGGDAPYPIDPSLFQVSPKSCPGPYWIYAGLIKK